MLWMWVLACAGEKAADTGAAVDPISWSVSGAGGFNVGYRAVEQTYTDPVGESVTVTVNLWFPTDDTDGEPAVYFGVFEDEQALDGADPAGPVHAGGYPVLVFSHGSFLYGGSSSFLARHFASHGWIVAAPDQTGHTLDHAIQGRPLSVNYHRPLNDSAAIDAVAAQADLGPDAVTDAVIASGYSYGGYDAWVLLGAGISRDGFAADCAAGIYEECPEAQLDLLESGDFSDERVVGVVSLTGARRMHYFADGGLQGLPGAALMMSGTADDSELDGYTEDPQGMWDAAAGTDLTWVSVEGGCHAMFSVGNCDSLDTETGYTIANAYSLAFARRTLLGDDSAEVQALLSGSDATWATSVQAR